MSSALYTHACCEAKKDNSRFTLKIYYYKYVVRKLVLPDFIIMYFPLRVKPKFGVVLKPNFSKSRYIENALYKTALYQGYLYMNEEGIKVVVCFILKCVLVLNIVLI